MSIEWIIGILASALAGLLYLYISHILACNERDRRWAQDVAVLREEVAVLKIELSDMKEEIGTHDTGIIGRLHRYGKVIRRLNDRMGAEKGVAAGLRDK